MKKWHLALSLVLLGGTVFAWFAVINDIIHFIELQGSFFVFRDTYVPHPLLTPCFWGAWAYLIALVWSVINYNKPAETQLKLYRRLNWLLVASVLFAWTVNIKELVKFFCRDDLSAPVVGCSGQLVANPFLTPCFIGASIFLIALLVGLVITKKQKMLN